jgi:SP family general alpha glucoside:H+ symporter-like MFS transporter
MAPTTPETVVIDTCIKVYTKHIYPVVPLLDVAVIKAQLPRLHNSLSAQRVVKTFCAYVSNFGIPYDNDHEASPSSAKAVKEHLLTLAMSAHNTFMRAHPGLLTVYCSFFLYGAWAGLGDYQQAWYYLREATTLYMMLRSDSDEWHDKKARHHLFWILVISER